MNSATARAIATVTRVTTKATGGAEIDLWNSPLSKKVDPAIAKPVNTKNEPRASAPTRARPFLGTQHFDPNPLYRPRLSPRFGELVICRICRIHLPQDNIASTALSTHSAAYPPASSQSPPVSLQCAPSFSFSAGCITSQSSADSLPQPIARPRAIPSATACSSPA